ncbi:protein-S-isoprenylcysteine O-methyltransferase-like [Ornithodoros turicata]|uniref:protein-S-isoprenylcysteine O-methyltransferase-like n=1 Tax=Ornithodoros turicata TaxID=34597 RepID=UPI003139D63D
MALSTNGRISLYCFCLAGSVVFISLISLLSTLLSYVVEDYWLFLAAIYSVCIHGVLYLFYKPRGYAYKIVWRAALLGTGAGIGLLTTIHAPSSWKVFGWYMILICTFHFSEYFTTAIVNPKSLNLDTFLLNHSREYGVAAVCSWIEFLLERSLYPDLKETWWISVVGFVLCITGEVLRKAAMFTAGTNFNHIIQCHREEGHVLVTHGVYSLCRHPSYVGWFLWSVGTQTVLVNPVCIIAYALASWKFFKTRVEAEEVTLLNFFGEDYVQYQKRTCTGLPFIYGFRVEL